MDRQAQQGYWPSVHGNIKPNVQYLIPESQTVLNSEKLKNQGCHAETKKTSEFASKTKYIQRPKHTDVTGLRIRDKGPRPAVTEAAALASHRDISAVQLHCHVSCLSKTPNNSKIPDLIITKIKSYQNKINSMQEGQLFQQMVLEQLTIPRQKINK